MTGPVFNAYHVWLGIPLKDQPPNHYRLLCIELFESNLDVIEGAADRQIGFVRQYQSGEHAKDAAQILNELALARLCLLKPATKDAYDAKLRQQLAPPFEFEQPSSGNVDTGRLTRTPRKKMSASKALPVNRLLISGSIAAVIVALVVILFNSRAHPPTGSPGKPVSVAARPTDTTESTEAE